MQPYQTLLPAGAHWSFVMRSGSALTLTDVVGGASASLLFYNPENLLERYNAPDTLKCQHTFKLTTGHCLYSDMGRIFCSVIQDDTGWIDTVAGNCTSPAGWAPRRTLRFAVGSALTRVMRRVVLWPGARIVVPIGTTTKRGCSA